MTETTFPAGFLWGAATAGHQVEGGNLNADIWPVEWSPNSHFVEPSGDACDHYHRYRDDIELMSKLGFTAYRFSIEWSRVEPERGYFSRAELDHYRRVIAACHEVGITPVVSYNHFTLPRWLAGEGGWNSDSAPARFARYAAQVTDHVGDLVEWICTLNEPNALAVLMATGVIPMGTTGPSPAPPGQPVAVGVGGYDPASYRYGLIAGSIEQMAAVHRAGFDAIKSGRGTHNVGWTLALPDLQLGDGGDERWAQARQVAELDWLDASRADDFVGVQTYTRTIIGQDGALPIPEGSPVSQVDLEIYPEALAHTVTLAAEHSGVPVLVTEHGLATADDAARIEYTERSLRSLATVIADGIDVRAYLHWTLLDNFEWTAGFTKQFGLVAVDRHTFDRTVKPSAEWLGSVARVNALR
jgi:beta-glucosidase